MLASLGFEMNWLEIGSVACGVFVAFFMLFNRGEEIPSFFREPLTRKNVTAGAFSVAFLLNFVAAEIICQFVYEADGSKQNFLSALAAIGLIGGYKALQKYG